VYKVKSARNGHISWSKPRGRLWGTPMYIERRHRHFLARPTRQRQKSRPRNSKSTGSSKSTGRDRATRCASISSLWRCMHRSRWPRGFRSLRGFRQRALWSTEVDPTIVGPSVNFRHSRYFRYPLSHHTSRTLVPVHSCAATLSNGHAAHRTESSLSTSATSIQACLSWRLPDPTRARPVRLQSAGRDVCQRTAVARSQARAVPSRIWSDQQWIERQLH
jgi:hypothetical protein